MDSTILRFPSNPGNAAFVLPALILLCCDAAQRVVPAPTGLSSLSALPFSLSQLQHRLLNMLLSKWRIPFPPHSHPPSGLLLGALAQIPLPLESRPPLGTPNKAGLPVCVITALHTFQYLACLLLFNSDSLFIYMSSLATPGSKDYVLFNIIIFS